MMHAHTTHDTIHFTLQIVAREIGTTISVFPGKTFGKLTPAQTTKRREQLQVSQ